MKKLLFIPFLLTTLISHAYSNNNDLKINANILSGCSINMSDINIGEIKGIIKDVPISVSIFTICSKNTSFNIKTNAAQSIVSPSDSQSTFAYIYPMYHLTDPDKDFVGYRFLIVDPTYRVGSTEHFGDGTKNNKNVQTSYLSAIATGDVMEHPLSFRYWTYTHMKTGTYSASHTFTLEY